MQKKLIAMAVAGMAAVPAYAQLTSGVVLYGRAALGFDQYKATGSAAGGAADFGSRNRVWDNGSRIGVRGTENLGSGLSAIFLIESGVAADTAGAGTATSAGLAQNGSGNTATGALGSREAWGGLQGAWGTIKFGKQNVWWTNSTINQVQSNWLEVGSPLATGGHGIVAAPSTRTNNVVHYQTPSFSGFNASVYYSPQPTAAAGQETAAAGVDPKERYYAATLRYANGPITAQFDYGNRSHIGNDPLVGGVGQNRKVIGYKAGAAYTYMPSSQVSLIWVRDKAENIAAAIAGGTGTVLANAGDNIRSDSFTVEWEHTFGNIMAIAEYGQLMSLKGGGAGTSNSGTKAKYFNIGGRYNLSKRTALQAQYAQVRNDSNSWVDFTGGGMSGAPSAGLGLTAASSGADPRIISVGVQHNF